MAESPNTKNKRVIERLKEKVREYEDVINGLLISIRVLEQEGSPLEINGKDTP